MKIVSKGKVYNLDYGKYDTICSLQGNGCMNSVGNYCPTDSELRRDKASGLFYTCSSVCGGYTRDSVSVTPLTEKMAASIAEECLDYDAYVKFFGDPEGDAAQAKRERDEAVDAARSAEDSKDYWYRKYTEIEKERKELKAKLAEIEAAVANLKTEAAVANLKKGAE